MKKIFLSLAIIFAAIFTFAQDGHLGFYAGGSYYVGELNQRNVMYMPSPSFGLVYRHNFDKRITMRLGANYASLRGNDANSNNSYQTIRNYSFNRRIWDLGAQVELNFFNYQTDNLFKEFFTPYITTGLALAIVPDSRRIFEVAVPIGFGFKYLISKNITLGLEWTYKWTNSDELDGLQLDNYGLPVKQLSYNPNTDWYSFLGVVLTFKVFGEDMPCPAF